MTRAVVRSTRPARTLRPRCSSTRRSTGHDRPLRAAAPLSGAESGGPSDRDLHVAAALPRHGCRSRRGQPGTGVTDAALQRRCDRGARRERRLLRPSVELPATCGHPRTRNGARADPRRPGPPLRRGDHRRRRSGDRRAAWLGKELDWVFMAALLTVIGYSINDSVVVFDRIRELRRDRQREPLREVAQRRLPADGSPHHQHRPRSPVHPGRLLPARGRDAPRLRPGATHRHRRGDVLLGVHGHAPRPALRGPRQQVGYPLVATSPAAGRRGACSQSAHPDPHGDCGARPIRHLSIECGRGEAVAGAPGATEATDACDHPASAPQEAPKAIQEEMTNDGP